MTSEQKKFIQENVAADVNRLLLNPPSEFKSEIKFLAEQIQSRQKAKGKLPTWVENFDLTFPPPLSVEQCSSEETASYKSGLIKGQLLVDLTGGMGVDCLALSERFEQTIYVESQADLCDRFGRNAEILGRKIDVKNQSAEKFLSEFSLPEKTVFFIDPARRDEQAKKVFRFADCTPDVNELLNDFKKKAAKVLIKASPLIDLKQGLSELSHVVEIHVVSVTNDCKEVLFLLDFEKQPHEPIIKTINLAKRTERFGFTFSEEELAESEFGEVGEVLLIPNSSILKAGAFKSVGKSFALKKLAVNTHLFTSEKQVDNFPGRQFTILEKQVDKKVLKTYGVESRVNVISRNHPHSPEQILKKFKLKEGGDLYIIGFRDQRNKPQLTLCWPI